MKWQYSFPKTNDKNLPLPFFIQWDELDEDRMEELQRNQYLNQHSNKKIVYIAFAVHNFHETATIWSKVLGMDYTREEDDLGTYASIPLAGGQLRFYSNIESRLIFNILKTHGESPFMICISGNEVEKNINLCNGIYRLK